MTHISYPLLLQYITQKICHDLATPIGAIRLGLEHMEESDLTPILMDSINNATTRLDIFRTFFSTSDSLDTEKVPKLLTSYLKSKNVIFENSGKTDSFGSKLMLGLGVFMCEALPRGGRIIVDFEKLSLKCDGAIVHLPFPLMQFELASLLEENLHFKSGIILFHILMLAEKKGLRLESSQESDGLSLVFMTEEIT